MFEEYYKFLCKRLVSWADNVEIAPGDRYVLSFEEIQQVTDFMTTLAALPDVEIFHVDPENQNFTGLAVTLKPEQKMKLVIVSTDNVTPDYLVNLRNQIGRQRGVWKQTALLFVSNQILDSINSGAKDISRQGGPFNLDELRKNLESEIDQSDEFTAKEREILRTMILVFFKGEQTYTLMDFADAYAIIEKGKIEPKDYTQMGYFQDKSLLSYAENEIRDRLEANHNDFARISLLQGFGDTKEKLNKLVAGDSLTSDLAGNDWKKVDYKRILAGKDELQQTSQIKINYLADQLQQNNAKFKIWDRPQKTTKAGQRNRQILVFNPEGMTDVTVTIPFDQTVRKDGLSKLASKSRNPEVILTGHHLKLVFHGLSTQTDAAFKVVYKHQNKASLRFTFNVVVVPFSEDLLQSIRPMYTLRIGRKNQYVIQLPSDVDDFSLGTGQTVKAIEATSVADIDGIEVAHSDRILIKTSGLILGDDTEDQFTVHFVGLNVTFSLVDDEERVVPRNAVFLENFRRQHRFDGYYHNKQIFFGETAFSVYDTQKELLDQEVAATQNDDFYPKHGDFQLTAVLTRLYFKLFSILRQRNTVMSLVRWDDQIKTAVQAILDEVQLEIGQTTDGIEVAADIRQIVHIGEIEWHGNLAFAPFNPILLAYQLQVEQTIGTEELADTIQRKLSPGHLVPFIRREGTDYKAYYVSNAPRWLIYSQTKLSRFSEVSQKIVTERLKDFKKHFSYLFEVNAKSHYNVQAVNVKDEKPLLKSVTDYLIYEIGQHKEDLDQINPVALYIVNQKAPNVNSVISGFYKIQNKTDYEHFFHESLKTVAGVNAVQVIETIQRKLDVFNGDNDQIDYHMTFYQFANDLTLSQYSTEQLTMNYSIDGLIGGDEYTNVQQSIKSGFGTKGLKSEQASDVIRLAQSWNELLVTTAQRHGVMSHGQTLTNSVEEVDNRDFQSQFDRSKWVTLLNPEVKLDYFTQMNQKIYVIHYTDYTNSANYESITLTKKVHQYEIILSENLPKTVKERTDNEFLNTIIKSFNIINGEWLLRLVSHRKQKTVVKEKLSIIAVYKEMLGILDRPDIIWVPLSLEEILRVSGSFVGETRNDAIFSAQNLGTKGAISDDLLFIGLWKCKGQLKVTFLPTEVKVGQNNTTVINKANSQVEKTFNVLKKNIFDATDFKADFYLDFFMKLFFANAAKLNGNGNLDDETYQRLQNYRQAIVQGNLRVDNSLTDAYHNKFIFSLKADEANRILRLTDHCALVEVPESDAFYFSGVSTEKVIDAIQQEDFGFDKSRLLNELSDNSETPTCAQAQSTATAPGIMSESDRDTLSYNSEQQSDGEISTMENSMPTETVLATGESVAEPPTSELATESIKTAPQPKDESNDAAVHAMNRRMMLGTIEGATAKDYWEYDNHQLANRHMLITGKSGQGKTYFIQTLLYEFAKQKTDTLIIDYTDSYLPGQLDALLEDQVPNIHQHIVKQEGLAINPFKSNQVRIGDYQYPEKPEEIASRVSEVLNFVFNLGVQQKSRLKTILMDGIKEHPHYSFKLLREQLLESKDDQTLYGRLQPLLDDDVFTYDEAFFDWSEYFGHQGQINIIQLSRFTATVQKAMIEFILWDLFNYSQNHKAQEFVYPVFLDEVQNLNFARESPIFKILTEGRKFGWSGVFATQSLSSINGEVDAIYNSAEQIHFLPPENQTRAIAKTLSSDRNEQRNFETMLSSLRKGQCIVNGPTLTADNQLTKRADVVNVDSLQSRIR